MNIFTYFFSFASIWMVSSTCLAQKPYYKSGDGINFLIDSSEIDYELFLVGDIGLESNSLGPDALVTMIKSQLSSDQKNQTVVFLGNSLSTSGLPDRETTSFDLLGKSLKTCMTHLTEKTEHVFFVPGKNEWFDGNKYTIAALQASEDFIENLADGKNVFRPNNGCGEPLIVNLTDDLILVIIDSQWMLQSDDSQERKKSGCEIDNNIDFTNFMNEVIAKNKRKNIVIATHHPIYSNGKVGGNYPIKNHLLPLPLIGSLITGVRKIMGGPQQFGHPDYEAYRSAYLEGVKNCEGCITVSGNDNNLQYFFKQKNHFAVAGSGSKVDYVRKADGAEFSSMSQGFVKIVHTKDLELWMEFYGVEVETQSLKLLYRKFLYKKKIVDYKDQTVFIPKNERPAVIKVNASDFYGKKKILRGNLYREAWKQEIEAPLLWLDETYDGLKPIQQGGGFQTASLRLENQNGVQYVLRSINKDVEKLVPPALRNTSAQNIVQDGIGASHPYGAFVIPTLAAATGIYHANPKIVYLPAQQTLGDYNDAYSEKLYLFEERPGGNTSVHQDYDHTEKTVNTIKVLELLSKNHKHKVDQQFVLRSRLFDIWIGDWDRHDDQWRWATFKKDGYTLYRPIPRDRDQVFFKNDGFLSYIASRPFFNPQLRKFSEDVDFLPGLIFNARHFDRSFLHELTKEDFINMAIELQSKLTDELIDMAFKEWPEEIQNLDAEEIKNKLRSRRSKLTQYAAAFYDLLYKEVAIIGTNSENIFIVEFLDNNQVKVVVFHEKQNDKHNIYQRVLSGKTTEEIRLFGLKKDDKFIIKGNNKSSVKIRIIGGSGEDVVTNETNNHNVIVYDRPTGMTVIGLHHSEIKDEGGVNRYDRKDWKQNRFIHFPIASFYTDEGIGLTYNIWWKKFGFRSDPFKSSHRFDFSYYPKNSAFVVNYSGYYPEALNNWDFELDVTGFGPAFIQQFYGLGNEYINFGIFFPEIEKASSSTFHIVKGTRIDINPSFIKKTGKSPSFKINPSFEFISIKNSDDSPRFYLLPEARITEDEKKSKSYAGLRLEWISKRIDSPTIPSRGFDFNLFADYKLNLNNSEFSNLTLGTELQTYIPFNQSKTVVLSMNLGSAYTVGDYEFFHANYLSTASRLRGFKNYRFAGDGIAYHATDLRIQIFENKGNLPASWGVFGSFDYGRVWYDKEENEDNNWHTSFGGGIYLIPLEMVGFRIGYFVGEDDKNLTIGGALSF